MCQFSGPARSWLAVASAAHRLIRIDSSRWTIGVEVHPLQLAVLTLDPALVQLLMTAKAPANDRVSTAKAQLASS